LLPVLIRVVVESKTEPLTTDETGQSEFAEPSSSVEPTVAGDNMKQPVTTDYPDTDLTLSSCEYVPAGEL